MTVFEEFAWPHEGSAAPEAAELPVQEVLERALRCLSAGGLLAHPTTSVFGLGGPVRPDVEAEVSRLKGYSAPRPYIRLVSSAAQVSTAFPSAVWNDAAQQIADRFWPGPVTLVLDDGTAEGIALRAEGNRFMRLLLEEWGNGVLSSSLNRRGEPVSSTRTDVVAALADLPHSDFAVTLISEDQLPGPPPSSILSLRKGPVRLLRAGAISVNEIGACLGLDPRVLDPQGLIAGAAE